MDSFSTKRMSLQGKQKKTDEQIAQLQGGLQQLQNYLSDALRGVGVELEYRVTNGPRGEEEAYDLQQDRIRCKGTPGEVIDDSQLTVPPICRLATCASQRERTLHGEYVALGQ